MLFCFHKKNIHQFYIVNYQTILISKKKMCIKEKIHEINAKRVKIE